MDRLDRLPYRELIFQFDLENEFFEKYKIQSLYFSFSFKVKLSNFFSII